MVISVLEMIVSDAKSVIIATKIICSVLATASNYNLGSIGDKNLGGAGADPARPAGYNRNLSFEWQHRNSPLVLGSQYCGCLSSSPLRDQYPNGGRTPSMTSEVMKTHG